MRRRRERRELSPSLLLFPFPPRITSLREKRTASSRGLVFDRHEKRDSRREPTMGVWTEKKASRGRCISPRRCFVRQGRKWEKSDRREETENSQTSYLRSTHQDRSVPQGRKTFRSRGDGVKASLRERCVSFSAEDFYGKEIMKKEREEGNRDK